jgi:hypothetical protein
MCLIRLNQKGSARWLLAGTVHDDPPGLTQTSDRTCFPDQTAQRHVTDAPHRPIQRERFSHGRQPGTAPRAAAPRVHAAAGLRCRLGKASKAQAQLPPQASHQQPTLHAIRASSSSSSSNPRTLPLVAIAIRRPARFDPANPSPSPPLPGGSSSGNPPWIRRTCPSTTRTTAARTTLDTTTT